MSKKWKQQKNKELGTHSLACNILGVGGGMFELWDGIRKNDKQSIIHTDLHKTKQQVG